MFVVPALCISHPSLTRIGRGEKESGTGGGAWGPGEVQASVRLEGRRSYSHAQSVCWRDGRNLRSASIESGRAPRSHYVVYAIGCSRSPPMVLPKRPHLRARPLPTSCSKASLQLRPCAGHCLLATITDLLPTRHLLRLAPRPLCVQHAWRLSLHPSTCACVSLSHSLHSSPPLSLSSSSLLHPQCVLLPRTRHISFRAPRYAIF